MNNGIPTLWQTVVFRNWGMVRAEKLAEVLRTDEATVYNEARALGLDRMSYDPDWVDKGFVTIIRNNWDVLPNEDIRTLLSVTEKEWHALLAEYDFLDVKLGEKPVVHSVKYAPLSAAQRLQTEKIGAFVREKFRLHTVKPFDFYANAPTPVYLPCGAERVSDRFTASYDARYSGALLDDDLRDYPRSYLQRLAAAGVNGIWLQETLRNLAEFPFDDSYSEGYERRVKNLRKLTERCEEFGIGVYLYMNEPRSMPLEFFEKYPHLKGQDVGDGTACLCTSSEAVQNYLYRAVRSLAASVPKLCAVMTITMSENPTHCYSRPWKEASQTDCPRCRERAPEEIAAEVNNIFCRALRDGNGKTRLIANLWGWSEYMGWTEEMTRRGISLLDRQIEVLCVSEFCKKFERGGVSGEVIDYSISVIGPSDFTVKTLSYAREKGHRVWAKMQANNSWECSAAPYVPAFGLMLRHLNALKKLDVSGFMMGWSLGGYPGGALPLLSTACAENADTSVWYLQTYGESAETVMRACEIFDDAFSEYPFSVDVLYFGGHNLGCGNFWSLEKDERKSTMVCYAFDDLQSWTKPYGAEKYISQMRILTEKWQQGLKILFGVKGNQAFEEYVRCARACYVHLRSAMLLAEFSLLKQDVSVNRARLLNCVEEEKSLTEETYRLICEDAKIGFEMTNHYYYNANRLLEKLLNLHYVSEQLRENRA